MYAALQFDLGDKILRTNFWSPRVGNYNIMLSLLCPGWRKLIPSVRTKLFNSILRNLRARKKVAEFFHIKCFNFCLSSHHTLYALLQQCKFSWQTSKKSKVKSSWDSPSGSIHKGIKGYKVKSNQWVEKNEWNLYTKVTSILLMTDLVENPETCESLVISSCDSSTWSHKVLVLWDRSMSHLGQNEEPRPW